MTGLEIALKHAFNERDEEIAKLRADIAVLTEQRDRAMAVVEAAKALGEAMNKCKPCDKEFAALWAALDAEAAAETEGR